MLARKFLKSVAGRKLLQPGDRVLVAVSGGADSLCLLHLLRRVAPLLKIKLAVAHLDHRFRSEARQELLVLRSLAHRWKLPFYGAAADVPAYQKKKGLSPQEAAREIRYRFLLTTARRYGYNKLAVAHQRDDQVETVLFNFLRGSGLDGLAGMAPLRLCGDLAVVRPLLEFSRLEIEAYCCRYRLQPVVDESNLHSVYTRNRLRLELIPQLRKQYNPRLTEALQKTACLLAADRDYLRRQSRKAFQSLAQYEGQRLIIDLKRLLRLPAALRGRVARLAMARLAPSGEIGFKQVQRLLEICKSSNPSAQFAFPGGGAVFRSYGKLIFSKTSAEEKYPLNRPLLVPGRTPVSPGGVIEAQLCDPAGLSWPPPPGQAYLDYERLPGTLFLRTRWPGARFHPQGLEGSKKLKQFFIDQKLDRRLRDSYPLVTAGDEIIWVVGLRIAHPYRVTCETRQVLVLRYLRLSGEDEAGRERR